MDTNVVGRLMIPREKEDFSEANITTISVLDLTGETHGNASGVSLANVTTRRLYEKVDWYATYTNALTSGAFGIQKVSLPIVMLDDRMAIQAVVRGCGSRSDSARMVFIENTLRLDRMWINPSLLPDVQLNLHLAVIGECPLSFSATGTLRSPWYLTEE